MAKEQYRVLARYRVVGPDGHKRVYHATDVDGIGPSITLEAFHQGERPPAPDAAAVQSPAPPRTPAVGLPPRRPAPLTLTLRQFRALILARMTHGVPAPPQTLDRVIEAQQQQRQHGRG